MLLLVSREAINARSSNVCTSPIDLRLDDSKFNIVNKEQQCLLVKTVFIATTVSSRADAPIMVQVRGKGGVPIGECPLIVVKDVTKEKERENELESLRFAGRVILR